MGGRNSCLNVGDDKGRQRPPHLVGAVERDKEHDERGAEDVVEEDAGLLAPGALYVSVVYTATSLSANFFFSLPENCAGCPVGFYSHETSLLQES